MSIRKEIAMTASPVAPSPVVDIPQTSEARAARARSSTQVLREKLTTYHHLLIALRYVVLAHVVVGSFLVLAFCTSAGIFAAIVIAALELAVGLALAKDRKRPNWMSEAATLFISTSADSGHG
jgi:hypothetical protein